jgi:hypothetical protein
MCQGEIVRKWRGILLIIFLALWPFIWFLTSLSIFGFGGQCAVDSCGPNPTNHETFLFFLYMFLPPIVSVFVWGAWLLKYFKIKGLSNVT